MMAHPVHPVDLIVLRSRGEMPPEEEHPFHIHNLQQLSHQLALHLHLVMGLPRTLQVRREVLEIAVRILLARVVQEVDRERHAPELTDFCQILQGPQRPRIGQHVHSAGSCYCSQGAGLHVLQPSSYRRQPLPPWAPPACLLCHSHLFHA